MLCIAFLHVGGAVGCDVPIILSLSLSLSHVDTQYALQRMAFGFLTL